MINLQNDVPRSSRCGIFHNHNLCDFTEFVEVVSKAFCKKYKYYTINIYNYYTFNKLIFC